MFRKQDSAFWWTVDEYTKDLPEFKNLSIDQKKLIDETYQLAYFGLFQYQLYKGREITEIDPTKVQEISNYIIDNYDALAKAYGHFDDSSLAELKPEDKKSLLLDMLEHIIIPYISEHSFGTIEHYTPSKEAIGMMKMQLAIRNQYDINYHNKDNPDELYYSPIYPFLLTVLILDPINPDGIYDNAKSFYNIIEIQEAIQTGRMLSQKEKDYLFSSLDRLKSTEDFESLLNNFRKEKWELCDINQRFRLVFQLSKLTAILLKERINSITFLEDGNNIYDLLSDYLPIILQGPDELANYQIVNKGKAELEKQFLYPISFKDFDSKTLEEYFKQIKIGRIKYHYDKLTAFKLGMMYSLSRLHVINDLGKENVKLRDFLIRRDQIALCNSLMIFDKNDVNLKKLCSYDYNYEDGFIDQTSLKQILKQAKVTKASDEFVNDKLKPIARILSYILALDPSIVKKMDYSLEKLVKYYLICFGPYKKTKIGYEKSTISKLTSILEKFAKKYSKSNSKDADYHETFYLIDRLANFKRKKHN